MSRIPILVEELLKSSIVRIRFFLAGDPDPTEWGQWVVTPVEGYLEHEVYGPFRICDAERCQIVLDSESAQALHLLSLHGFKKLENGFFESNTNGDAAP